MKDKFYYLERAREFGFNIPEFALLDTNDVEKSINDFLSHNPTCILRSSPSVSMPGCFESYRNCRTLSDVVEAALKMQMDLSSQKVGIISRILKIKDLSIRSIMQRQIEGISGVATTHNVHGYLDLSFSASQIQGGVTDGKVGSKIELSEVQKSLLKDLSVKLWNSFKIPVEFEFIFDSQNILWLLQVRKQILSASVFQNVFLNSPEEFRDSLEEYAKECNMTSFLEHNDVEPENKKEIGFGLSSVFAKVSGIFDKDILLLDDLEAGQEHLLENVKAILTFSSDYVHCHLISLCNKLRIPIITHLFLHEPLKTGSNLFINSFTGKIYIA